MISPMRPFFSVIIPTYNRWKFLQIAVNSVLAQTYPYFELIVIDDGSTDETAKWIRSISDNRLRYIAQSHKGVSEARNYGLSVAKGTFIAFLDSDDWWARHKLERTKHFIDCHPEIKIFHTEEQWFKGDKVVHPKKKHQKPTGWVYPKALELCCISISTAVVHQDVFGAVGVFDESLPVCEDYDFWLRATSRFEVFLMPEVLTFKDGGRKDQLSAQLGLDRYRIQALKKMLDNGGLSSEDYAATVAEMKRKIEIYIKGAQKRKKHEEVAFYQNLLAQYQDRP